MKKLIKCPVSTVTVRLIGRLLLPLAESGTISVPEMNEVMSNLRHLAQKGEMLPDVVPKLIDQKKAAEMLGVSFAHFRNLERDGVFPFKRRKVGTAVRYYNIDVYKYILTLPEDEQNKSQLPTENNSS